MRANNFTVIVTQRDESPRNESFDKIFGIPFLEARESLELSHPEQELFFHNLGAYTFIVYFRCFVEDPCVLINRKDQ
jgi:hypothetical protein